MRKLLARIAHRLFHDEINEIAGALPATPIAVVVDMAMTPVAAEQVARIASAQAGRRVGLSYLTPSGDRTLLR